MLKFLIILISIISLSYAYVSYDGYKVYRIYLDSKEKIQAYNNIKKGVANLNTFGQSIVKKSLDVAVDPENQEKFLKQLKAHGIDQETYIEDLEAVIQETSPRISGRSTDVFNWTSYHNYDVIYNWMDSLVTTYPNIVSSFTIGKTHLGVDIKGVKVVFNSSATKIAVIDGGIHAREWITPATVTYILNEFLTTTDPNIRKTAEKMIWYFIPVLNPDGYDTTFRKNRMHRKNMQQDNNSVDCSQSSGGNGYGTDLNRNYNFSWMESEGASSNPCSESYAGSSPFSAPETRAFRDFIQEISKDLVLYLNFHSYSQLFLFPYGHTPDPLDNYYEQYAIGRMATDALRTYSGTDYTVGNTAEAIYIATGTIIDWVKGTYGTTLVYCVELRDIGQYGFLLPPDQIIDTSHETLLSIPVLVEQLFRIDLHKNVNENQDNSSAMGIIVRKELAILYLILAIFIQFFVLEIN